MTSSSVYRPDPQFPQKKCLLILPESPLTSHVLGVPNSSPYQPLLTTLFPFLKVAGSQRTLGDLERGPRHNSVGRKRTASPLLTPQHRLHPGSNRAGQDLFTFWQSVQWHNAVTAGSPSNWNWISRHAQLPVVVISADYEDPQVSCCCCFISKSGIRRGSTSIPIRSVQDIKVCPTTEGCPARPLFIRATLYYQV